jgi:spermidine dehydrogenase
VRDLGIDVTRWESTIDRALYPGQGMTRGTFFDRETFGADRLVRWPEPASLCRPAAGPAAAPGGALAQIPGGRPLSGQRGATCPPAHASVDYLPGLSADEKKARLAASATPTS